MEILKLYLLYKMGLPLALSLIVVIVVASIFLYEFVKFKFDEKFRQNCFECEHYGLYDVASAGGKCKYKCMKFDIINKHDMNDRYKFCKCKEYTSIKRDL